MIVYIAGRRCEDARNNSNRPIIKAVPVVRCKDCKHYGTLAPEDSDDDRRCLITDFYEWKPPMWYCADGERRRKDGKVD